MTRTAVGRGRWVCRAASGLALVLALAACSTERSERPSAANAQKPGIDTGGMDRSVAPGDDFFGYANGTWMAKTEIPADRRTPAVMITKENYKEIMKDQAN